jgi:hypothetical protein
MRAWRCSAASTPCPRRASCRNTLRGSPRRRSRACSPSGTHNSPEKSSSLLSRSISTSIPCPIFGEHPIVEYSTAIEFAVFRGVKGQSRAVRLEKRGNRPAIFGACRFLPPQMWAESCSEILAREKAHENGAAPAADLGWPSLKPRAKIGVGFEFYRRGTAFDQQR